MIQKFTSDPEYTEDKFLDCRAYNQDNPQDFPCQSIDSSSLSDISVSPEKKKIFEFLKERGLDTWAGAPVDLRGEYTNWFLKEFKAANLFMEIKNNPILSEFYGIDKE